MDHKAFFQDFGKFTLRDVDSEYTLEQLYQAFKQRLIEELRTKGGSDFGWVSGDQRLIDTTEKKDG